RLALPPRKDPYAITIEAINVSCQADPCGAQSVARLEFRTPRIAERQELESSEPRSRDALRRAVLIGIGVYENIQGLSYPVKDARAVMRALTNPFRAYTTDPFDFRNVVLFEDRQANTSNIQNFLGGLATIQNGESVHHDQLFFLYFSGHGSKKPTGHTVLVNGVRTPVETGCLLLAD